VKLLLLPGFTQTRERRWNFELYIIQFVPLLPKLFVSQLSLLDKRESIGQQWRSNRLCRLCSAQGPPGIQGPPTAWAVALAYLYGTDVPMSWTDADLLPPLQSGFRPGHSTETAVLRVLSDILLVVDRGDFAAVVLDLAAAFDTVDHDILLQRLESSFGIVDAALDWFQTYLSGRKQFVRCWGSRLPVVPLICGVPQRSVLGPVLFILYVADLAALIEEHNLSPHQFADDIQINGSCPPSQVDDFSSTVTGCVNDVADWLRSNRLQLNPEKTELL